MHVCEQMRILGTMSTCDRTTCNGLCTWRRAVYVASTAECILAVAMYVELIRVLSVPADLVDRCKWYQCVRVLAMLATYVCRRAMMAPMRVTDSLG